MKLAFRKKIFSALSLSLLSLLFANLPTQAETTNKLASTAKPTVNSTAKLSASSLNQPVERAVIQTEIAAIPPAAVKPSQKVALNNTSQEPTVKFVGFTKSDKLNNLELNDAQTLKISSSISQENKTQLLKSNPKVSEGSALTSTPLATKASNLQPVNAVTPSVSQEQPEQVASLTVIPTGNASQLKAEPTNVPVKVAQTDANGNPIFRPTRSGPSYIGIGGNFGITGNSDLGGRSLAIISKLGLSDVWSVRPSVLFLSNFASFLIPLTYDFPQQRFLGSDVTIAPYLGGGVAITTGSDNTFGPLLTAGVDIPISRNFTANIAANLAFLRSTDLGVVVGIAYNFQ